MEGDADKDRVGGSHVLNTPPVYHAVLLASLQDARGLGESRVNEAGIGRSATAARGVLS